MKDRGLFDEEERLKVLSKLGDNLETLNKKINNEQIKHRLFSAAKMARSSNNVHPCTLFDSEFLQSKNIAAVITTAVRDRNECRVC